MSYCCLWQTAACANTPGQAGAHTFHYSTDSTCKTQGAKHSLFALAIEQFQGLELHMSWDSE